MVIISSPRVAERTPPPGHPERPERAEVFDAVADHWRDRGVTIEAPRPANVQELTLVHTSEYVQTIAETNGRAVMLDPDTFTSPESYEIALLAAGAAIEAARHAWHRGERAVALVRPPGHHAEPDKAMG